MARARADVAERQLRSVADTTLRQQAADAAVLNNLRRERDDARDLTRVALADAAELARSLAQRDKALEHVRSLLTAEREQTTALRRQLNESRMLVSSLQESAVTRRSSRNSHKLSSSNDLKAKGESGSAGNTPSMRRVRVRHRPSAAAVNGVAGADASSDDKGSTASADNSTSTTPRSRGQTNDKSALASLSSTNPGNVSSKYRNCLMNQNQLF